MLELNAMNFALAITELKRINAVIGTFPPEAANSVIKESDKASLAESAEKIAEAVALIGSKSAWVAADRLLKQLQANGEFTVGQLSCQTADIEKRFFDHLGFIKLFVVHDDRAGLFGGADTLLGSETASRYPSAWYDCEEAAKCLVLGRATACVFHSMRMLEIGVKALSRRLSIDDPVKASERNWGKMLEAVKGRIDELYPASRRRPSDEGTFLASVYASLDAIKHPWRNATMHVENIYTPEEAMHILQCSARLLQTMARGFDEEGKLSAPEPELLSLGDDECSP